MKNFKNNFLRLIDNGAIQAKGLVESFNDLVESFDIEAQMEYFNERKNALLAKSNELFKDFSDLLKQVKENLTDFSVTIPYDESIGEKLTYEIVDGKLKVEVTYNDESSTRSNKTEVLIPENCDCEAISLTKNTVMRTATITIPKKLKVKKADEDVLAAEEPMGEEPVQAPTREERAAMMDGDAIPNTDQGLVDEQEDAEAPQENAVQVENTSMYYCPALRTLLTEYEVENGRSIVGGHNVVKLSKEAEEEILSLMNQEQAEDVATNEEPMNEADGEEQAAEPTVSDEETEAPQAPTNTPRRAAPRRDGALRRDSSGRFVRREPNA